MGLTHYGDFFDLFESFRGDVNHFLLQDLVGDDGETVQKFLPFEDYEVTQALPQSVEDYRTYRENAMAFLSARNRRITAWAREQLREERIGEN